MVGVLALAIATIAMPAAAHKGKGKPHHAGFKTSQAAMLDPAVPGATVTPLITVGETLPGSTYKFESIPDGIALRKGKGWKVEAYVNHETSTVPFPFTPGTPPVQGTGFNDFTNALLSKLTLSRHGGGVLSGKYVIQSEQNYQRFCSNTLVSRREGFERPLLFTNEEATDLVNRTGTAWPAGANPEQAGVVAAHDVKSGQTRSIYGMGRHNHENSVGVPGYGYPVVLSGDDTFTAPASQLYMYTARNGQAVWNDEGELWAFRSTQANDYGDLSGTMSISGEFIQVPRIIATGKKPDGTDAKSADVGFPTPPASAGLPDGPQWLLEHWSNTNNVFQFIRVEDIQYDRHHRNVVYFADSGEPRALPDPATGRLRRGPAGTIGPWPNGRIFKMVLDREDPKKVTSLSILVDGDSPRRRRLRGARPDPPAGQRRDDEGPAVVAGGPGQPQPVPAGDRHHGSDLGLRPEEGRRAVRRRPRQPVGRRGPDGRRCEHDQGERRRVGVERHRGRVEVLRQGRVPGRHPGRLADRPGGGPRRGQQPPHVPA